MAQFQARLVNGIPYILGRVDDKDVTISLNVENYGGIPDVKTAQLIAVLLNEGTVVLDQRAKAATPSPAPDFHLEGWGELEP